MALTISTGRTTVNNADSVTNWAAVRWAGTGGAPAAALDTTVFKEGSGAVSMKAAGNSWNSGLLYDWYASAVNKTANTTVDLTATGNEVIGLWVLMTTPSVMLTLASGGMYVVLSSSADSGTTAPTVYSEWWVYGSATYPGGWTYILLDTRKTPSSTTGGGCNLAAVRRIGVGVRNTASVGTVKADNLFIDFVSYKRPLYKVVGDGSTVATWADFYNNSDSAKNGLIELNGGVYFASCGFQFGDSAQGATTTFSDATGQPIVFRRYTYHNGSSVVDAVGYSDVYKITADGAASFKTSVQLGSVVGTGDDRQGVLGGGIRTGNVSNMTWSMDFATNISNLTSVKLYGVDVVGAQAGLLLDDSTKTSMISCGIVNSGEINPGSTNGGAEILSVAVIDPLGATNNRGIRINSSNNVKKVSCITSGSPATQHMVHLPTAGNYSVNFDAISFYGDYSSGTLWHGENSGSTSGQTATVNKVNDSNPDAAEFNNTGGGTTSVPAVGATVTFSAQVSLVGAEIRIYDLDAVSPPGAGPYLGTELAGTDSNGSSTYAYPGSVGNTIWVQIMLDGYVEYGQQLTIPSSDATIPIILQPEQFE